MADLRTLGPARGLAVDAEGKLLDLPRDLAHSVSAEIIDVVTLLHAWRLETELGCEEDRDETTSAESRAEALIHMADDKLRGVLRAISPYV